jgi:ribonuclease HII
MKPRRSTDDNIIEVGCDEAGRGSLLGPIFAGAVIWPKSLTTYIVKDSKKYKNHIDRLSAYEYIKKNAIAYAYAYCDNEEIDKIGIQEANVKIFHKAVDNLYIKPDLILIDGTIKVLGMEATVETYKHGDDIYYSIAAASVIAKVEHDKYIMKMCSEYPILNRYELLDNMGYAGKNHINLINQFGITNFHRQSYKCCTGKTLINL